MDIHFCFFYFTNLGKRLGSIPSICIQGYLARSNVYSCCWAFDLIFQIKSEKKKGMKIYHLLVIPVGNGNNMIHEGIC